MRDDDEASMSSMEAVVIGEIFVFFMLGMLFLLNDFFPGLW